MPSFRAAVLKSCTSKQPFSTSQPLEMATVDAPDPQAGEVLIKVNAASLCRSDLSVITGVRAWPMPIIPGHEASGTVVEVGAGISHLKPNDQVVMVYQPSCGVCPCCVRGDDYLCEPGLAANRAGRLLDGGSALSWQEQRVHHHMGLSGFAELALVSQKSLVKVDSTLSPDVAALFGCAVMCGAGSVIHTGALQAGESIVIVGLGGVGASAVLGARLAGAGQIIVVDLDSSKRDLALSLGADRFVAGGEHAADAVLELSRGGVDCALESAGTLAAFETAYGAARRGGRVITLGLVDPATPFSLDVAAHVTSAKSIHGSYMGSCNPTRDIPLFIDAYRAGNFPVEQLISHRLPLADVNIALERMASSDALRQILIP